MGTGYGSGGTDTFISNPTLAAVMRVREWQDIVADVVEQNVDPDGWRAIGGNRASGLGEDLYLAHPSGGVYGLKTYAKNPFEVKGVGGQIARKLDDEIGSYLPRDDHHAGRFAVRSPPEDESDAESKAKAVEEVVRAHADAPTTPSALFDDVMEVLESPAFGPMEFEHADRPEGLDELSATFEDAEEALEAEFEDIIREDEVDRGFA